VCETLSAWSCEHIADDAALLVSELVTNVVVHARSDVAVRLWRTDSGIRVEIADRDPEAVVSRPFNPEALGGRGLHLVEALAREWGVRPAPPGKTVWFELGIEVSPGAPGVPTVGNEAPPMS
jgi:anti-sigma regulatory factor (Ser/Thr protein kinase)